MRVGTLFSGGLAALEFGLKYENLEHEIVFACEWDKYARLQYLHFHGEPTSNFYEDVSDMDGTKYKDSIDLMVWGSPCQDLSLAGKRKGFDGEKSSLFREGARIQSEVMPKAFIFENVKGLLSSNSGNDYKEVVKTFQDMGYLIASKVLNAKEHGTAQNRERVFIVGFLDVDQYHNFTFEEKTPLTKTLKDYLESDVDEKYYLSDKMIKGFIVHKDRHEAKGNGFKFDPKNHDELENINCLSCGYGTRATDTYIKEPQLNQIGFIKTNSQGNRVYKDDVSVTLSANGGGMGAKTGLYLIPSATKCGYEVANEGDGVSLSHLGSTTGRGRVGIQQCQTLTTSGNHGVVQDYRIRKLTPVECFRLQGIKNEDISLINSNTQSYRIAGNAIEVNTISSILRSLYKPKPKDTLF